MSLTLSDGELLLRTYHGRCGHRRQSNLPCATPNCKEGPATLDEDAARREGYATLVLLGEGKLHWVFRRHAVQFGDETHYLWKRLQAEE